MAGLEFERFEVVPNDEFRYYGIDFEFACVEDDEGSTGFHRYNGALRVGGLISESDDVEGVRIRYSGTQSFPRTNVKPVSGEFVVQGTSRESLEDRARQVVQKVQDEIFMASITGIGETRQVLPKL